MKQTRMIDEFHISNRLALTRLLNGGTYILSAHTRLQRKADASFAFEQESNFWYLTGIEEADWSLVVDGASDRSWLIMPDIDEVHRVFDGGMSADEAKRISGVHSVVDAKEGQAIIRRLSKRHSIVNTIGQPPHSDYFNFALNPSTVKNWTMLDRIFSSVSDCRKELDSLRAIKRPEEIRQIQKAVDYTTSAFRAIHGKFQQYKYEYQVEADFSRDIRFSGSDGCAYDSIVGAGINACTLHYSSNNSSILSRQFVLMDMGAQSNHYAADITRTYVKGEATRRQNQVHAAVESAHYKIIQLIEPMFSVELYQKQVNSIMSDALSSIGLQSDESGLRRYFPHAISHGLGLDVHDSLGAPKYFQENMVLTVEPGIYIPEEKIGVRIEDDILVTKTGNKNLSGSLSTGL